MSAILIIFALVAWIRSVDAIIVAGLFVSAGLYAVSESVDKYDVCSMSTFYG